MPGRRWACRARLWRCWTCTHECSWTADVSRASLLSTPVLLILNTKLIHWIKKIYYNLRINSRDIAIELSIVGFLLLYSLVYKVTLKKVLLFCNYIFFLHLFIENFHKITFVGPPWQFVAETGTAWTVCETWATRQTSSRGFVLSTWSIGCSSWATNREISECQLPNHFFCFSKIIKI